MLKYKQKIDFPMFESSLLVLVGEEMEIIEEIENYNYSSEEKRKSSISKAKLHIPHTNGCCGPLEGRNFVIMIDTDKPCFKEDWKKNIIKVLTHEVRHYIDRLHRILSINDTETAAYMTGYICGIVLPELL